ncbi:MHS family alpha-ketoglutarate permease-like MFS transporter [Psychromicrobium silvestre]|uniref:Putative proline/betaine transporter n=1 Tax=Psychromicrobium silvestre TaxID=1645614 RepID=A0A7Y9S7B7_9MICC|nr:MFS transporter [Psychromicrobium silvestre]NYE95973.1 MHS family alpha-ketoglutarate permease-like MFS transporter [Psychromicrobium silvestre]
MSQVVAKNLPVTNHFRQVLAAGVGNAVEWYDWYIYSFLALNFSGQIFPSSDPTASLLSAFVVFAVGFLLRPIGGLLVGNLADRIGRKNTLVLTITAMGLGSLIVGLTPTFASAGLWAPIILILGRLISGLSVGGEFAANTVFLVESAPANRRGFFSSFQYVSTTAGQLIASGFATVLVRSLNEAEMSSWGWRLPFFFGAVLSLIGLWIRRGTQETLEVAPEAKRPGVFDAIIKYPKQTLLIVGITIAGTILYYTWTTYLATYVPAGGVTSQGDFLLISTIALFFFMVIQPVVGILSDRIGRRPLLIGYSAIFAVGIVPALFLLTRLGFWGVLLVTMLGMLVLSGFTSISAAVNAETIPTHVRSAGIGFPYSFTVALFGGTAPTMGTLFKSWGVPELFGWYVALLSLISLAVYIFALKETAHKPLPE